MERLLIFDTSGAACSAAILADGRVVAERYRAMVRGHAEHLVPALGETLAAAGLAWDRLDGIGVTRGPGAFTGLRIGLAAARGLALVLDIPVIGITTFEALAVRAPAGCVVAIDTRREDFYCQRCGPGGTAAGRPEILPAAGALALARAGGLPLVADTPGLAGESAPAGPPRAAEFAPAIAARYREHGGAGRPGFAMPQPFYLRPPAARLPETASAGT